MQNNPGIIVLGGHVQGYGIVRIYGENNISSIIVDSNKFNISRHSKYCKKFYQVEYRNLKEFFIQLGEKGEYKSWLLIPTDDYYVRFLSQNKTVLNHYFIVTVDDWDIINIFFNKRNSYPLAESVGVPIPKTLYPNSTDKLEKCIPNITYPCIIKPAIMLDFYRYFKRKYLFVKMRLI